MVSFVSLIVILDRRLKPGVIASPPASRHLQNDDTEISAASIEEPVLCSAELNLYCPPKMKCCPQYSSESMAVNRKLQFLETKSIIGYNCLAASKGKYPVGECCTDIDDTGCSIGYTCSVPSDKEGGGELLNIPHCQLDTSQHPLDIYGHPIEFQFDTMPRYHTCSARKYEDYKPFGLPIPTSVARRSGRKLVSSEENEFLGQLAYYTNKNSLDVIDDKIKTAIVTIHGSSRNSSNYLCFMMRAVKDYVASLTYKARSFHLKNNVDSDPVSEDEYIVIAPWFLAPQDGTPRSSSSLPFLRWDDEKPIAHTFRYGAESLEIDGSTVSSFAAMDILLEALCSKKSFPNLNKVVVAGHSAGGQFVHRYGISSSSWCLDTNEKDSHPRVKLVAANPRSYAYLDQRRYFPTNTVGEDMVYDPLFVLDDHDGDVQVLELRGLNSRELDDCPEYNSYEWGLDYNADLPAPYIMSNLDPFDDVNDEIFCRYAVRDVVYLSGERDVEKLGNQICHEDGYQGPTRRQRSERFYSSLQVIGKEAGYCGRDDDGSDGGKIHERVVVKNVGHDHALIYVMEEGQRVLFE